MRDAAGKFIGYGIGDDSEECLKVNRRLLHVYPRNSKALDLGVVESTTFSDVTRLALINLCTFMNTDRASLDRFKLIGVQTPLRTDGVADLNVRKAIGAYVARVGARRKKYFQQGVGFSTDAFLMGDPSHSYVDSLNEGAPELLRLAAPTAGIPKAILGYSMGDDVCYEALRQWPANRRDEVRCYIGFGSPTKPLGRGYGRDFGGAGIANKPPLDWVQDRATYFAADGDMYPNSVGLLPALYQVLIRLEATPEFAMYLFQLFVTNVGGLLLGTVASQLPFAGVLSGLSGMLTPGSFTSNLPGTPGGQINLMSMVANIGAIVPTILTALKFVSTNAHFHYHDQPQPFWRGLTAVDCAAQIIQEAMPDGGIVYTVPGTVSWWNDGPPAWTAWKLP